MEIMIGSLKIIIIKKGYVAAGTKMQKEDLSRTNQ